MLEDISSSGAWVQAEASESLAAYKAEEGFNGGEQLPTIGSVPDKAQADSGTKQAR